VEKGFNTREKYGDNGVSKAACCYLTSWYGKLGDFAICSLPSPVCCLRTELVWITCWKLYLFRGSVASGAPVDRK